MKEKKQKYERKKEVEDKTRNKNFAAALDYLKRHSETKLYQKDLAEMRGVQKTPFPTSSAAARQFPRT